MAGPTLLKNHTSLNFMNLCLLDKGKFYASPVYNDLLNRCWNHNPLKRPSIKEILNSNVVNNNGIEGYKLFRNNSHLTEGRCTPLTKVINDVNDRFGDNSKFNDIIRIEFVNSQMPVTFIL